LETWEVTKRLLAAAFQRLLRVNADLCIDTAVII
jgi:hypothetical protein